jgi:hypothetical protein
MQQRLSRIARMRSIHTTYPLQIHRGMVAQWPLGETCLPCFGSVDNCSLSYLLKVLDEPIKGLECFDV